MKVSLIFIIQLGKHCRKLKDNIFPWFSWQQHIPKNKIILLIHYPKNWKHSWISQFHLHGVNKHWILISKSTQWLQYKRTWRSITINKHAYHWTVQTMQDYKNILFNYSNRLDRHEECKQNATLIEFIEIKIWQCITPLFRVSRFRQSWMVRMACHHHRRICCWIQPCRETNEFRHESKVLKLNILPKENNHDYKSDRRILQYKNFFVLI